MKNFLTINNKLLVRQVLTVILTMALLFTLYGKTNAQCSGGSTIHITHDTTWTMAPGNFFGQDIVVSDGATFTIECNLSFQSGHGISNSPTSLSVSRLVVIESVLQGCSGGDWAGISFQGIANASGGNYTEYDIALNPSTTQNEVYIDKSTIKDAAIGVYVFDHAMVIISRSIFLDNTIGIKIDESAQADYYYPAIMSSTNYIRSGSQILNNTFNIHHTNLSNLNMNQYKCIDLISTQYLEIEADTFECTDSSANNWSNADNRATGISGTDASFSLHNTQASQDGTTKCLSYSDSSNVFRWLGTGVSTTNSGTPYNSYTMHVSKCFFQECFSAMKIVGGWFHTIENNHLIRFDPTQGSASAYWASGMATDVSDGEQYLVLLDGATDFIVYKDTITGNMYNMIFLGAINSGDHPTQITDNLITNTSTSVASNATFEAGIYLEGENGKEEVTGNNFGAHHKYGIATDNGGPYFPLAQFGDASHGVENSFTGSYSPGSNLYNSSTTSGRTNINYYSNTPNGSSLSTVNFTGHSASAPFVDDGTKFEDCTHWPLTPQGGAGINGGYGPMRDIHVYPNPANSQLVFDLSSIPDGNGAIVTIVDVLGKVISSYNYDDMGQKLVVNTSGYGPGIYIYRLTMNGYIENTGKFEVNH